MAVVMILPEGLTSSVSPFGEQLARRRYLLENCIKMPIAFKPLSPRRQVRRLKVTPSAEVDNCTAAKCRPYAA